MKIKKLINGNVVLINDAGKEYAKVPSDWLLARDLQNPIYFYMSPNGSNGGGVVIEWAKVTALIKSGVETAFSGNADALFTELSTNFFFKAAVSGGGGNLPSDFFDGNSLIQLKYLPESNLADFFNLTALGWESVGGKFQPISGVPTPVATSVALTGTPTQGQTLTGSYTYSGGTEGTSLKQWYRSDNTSGLNRTAISGATNSTYTLQAGDVGKYIQFAVTPKNSAGTSGTLVYSSYSAIIAASSGGTVGKTAQVVFTDSGNLPTSANWNSVLNSSLTTAKSLILNDGTASGWTLTPSRIGGGGSAFENTGTNSAGNAKFPIDITNKTTYFYGGQTLNLALSGFNDAKTYNIYTQHSTVDSGSGNVGDTKVTINGESKTTPILSNTGTRTSQLIFTGKVSSSGILNVLLELGPANALVSISGLVVEEVG